MNPQKMIYIISEKHKVHILIWYNYESSSFPSQIIPTRIVVNHRYKSILVHKYEIG